MTAKDGFSDGCLPPCWSSAVFRAHIAQPQGWAESTTLTHRRLDRRAVRIHSS
jgi:hypothetical protein